MKKKPKKRNKMKKCPKCNKLSYIKSIFGNICGNCFYESK